MITGELPDTRESSVRRLRRKLRRAAWRNLRRQQSGRYLQRLLLSGITLAIDPLVRGRLVVELVDAGLAGVAAALWRLDDEVDRARASIAREED